MSVINTTYTRYSVVDDSGRLCTLFTKGMKVPFLRGILKPVLDYRLTGSSDARASATAFPSFEEARKAIERTQEWNAMKSGTIPKLYVVRLAAVPLVRPRTNKRRLTE